MGASETLIEARRELDRADAFRRAIGMTNVARLTDEEKVRLDIEIARADAAYAAAFQRYHRLIAEEAA